MDVTTVKKGEGEPEYHFDEFEYDTSVSFIPPSPQSDSVHHINNLGQMEAATTLIGGDGGLGGSLGGLSEALGAGGTNPLMDQAMSMAEDVVDDDDFEGQDSLF